MKNLILLFLIISIYFNTSFAYSIYNGDSFSETFKNIGINTLVGAVSNLGAKQIGTNYHTGNINKTEQLLLHAGLGALTSELTGNDALTGAISGVVGEVVGEIYGNLGFDRKTGSELAGFTAGLSSLITGKMY